MRAACLLILVITGGCAYYNAMWSAERFARQARHAEASGQEVEARGLWGRAAVKAESVVARHPGSRWADDAMVLRAEALVRAGSCAQAAAPLARVRDLALDPDLRERIDLAAAQCFLADGRAGEAASLLTGLLASRDEDRRARAAYLAGQAAWAQGDGAAAAALLARSPLPVAGTARVHVLLGSGRVPEALALLDTMAGRRFREADWTALLDSTAASAGPAAASSALDRLLQHGRVPQDAAARLLTSDGDRRAAAREMPEASARYAAAAASAPDAATAELAHVRRLRALAANAETPADLTPLSDAIARARGMGDHRGLAMALTQIRQRDTDVEAFRAAELVRDSLLATRLAGALFIDVARRWPTSVFAPKAVVAAMALLPEQRDSLGDVLNGTYGQSPYAIALRGDAAAAFPAAEDSLARALGLELAAEPGTAAVTRVSPPVPGPRSVLLDPPLRAGPPQPPPASRVVVPPRPPRPGERPVERPVDRP
jgi:predicted negative regulator of RcsB-dependent stress response